ncbi:MAG TPA: PAS domain S-box protein [Gemmatimonas sp.]|nr:PAS domain S-box protein [Gemmatimonas sp.]
MIEPIVVHPQTAEALDEHGAMLSAVPAHIALLDGTGVIVAVNEAWKQFALANSLQTPDFFVGRNYVAVCEAAIGEDANEAVEAGAGTRAVLEGRVPQFALEYPCRLPTTDRWFRLMVTPRHDGNQRGAVVMHVDVTERKLVELALRQAERLARESEARLSFALEAAGIGDWDMDLRTNVARRSPRHDQCFGYDTLLPEWGYDTFLAHVHPDDRDMVNARFTAAMGGDGQYDVEFRTIWPDRTTHWLWSKGRFYFDDGGAPYRVAGLVVDITRRKDAEAVVERTVQRLTEAQRIGRIGDWEWEVSSGIITWSPEVFEIFGRDPQLGPPADFETHLELYDALSQQISREKVALALSSGKPQEYELVALRPDTGDVHVLSRAVPRFGASGEVVGMYGTVQDITDRKLQERQAMRLASIVESSDDAIVGETLDGIVTSWNRGAELMFGYSADEMVGASVARLFAEKRRDELQSNLDKLARGERIPPFETSRVRKDGRVVDVSITISPIRDRCGTVVGASKVARDISDQKKLERQFLRAQRLESIGTLAGGIAHDLNNVLTPIMLSLELLRLTVHDDANQELLDSIYRSSRHGADLVRQMLTFARGIDGERRDVRVSTLVRDVEQTARDTFLKYIDVRTSMPGDLWRVVGDPTQLQQVLMNLCVNARDAMPGGGTLTISAENVALDATEAALNTEAHAGPYVMVQVEDSGTGIAPGDMERIFDPFFTTKEVGQGTGLGLSTSQAIIKSHGGFIRVYSEPGNGTTFRVYLPARSGDAAEDVDAARELRRGHGELILVVDDELSVRHVTQKTLEAFGYRVVVATDGADALATYARRGDEIAAVLTDMMMPVMDGSATIRVLRKLNPSVRIIAASGLPNNGQETGAGLGVRHFLAKPYAADALLGVLDDCLHDGT